MWAVGLMTAILMLADIGLGCKCPPLTEEVRPGEWYCGRELQYMGARGCQLDNFYQCPYGAMQEAKKEISCTELNSKIPDPDRHFFKFCGLTCEKHQNPLSCNAGCAVSAEYLDIVIHKLYSRWGRPGPHPAIDERRRSMGRKRKSKKSKRRNRSTERKVFW